MTFLHQLLNLMDGIHEKPGTNTVLRIGDTIFENVDGLLHTRNASHRCANGCRIRFAVGLMNPMIALGHVIRNENVGEKLEWPLGIERHMKPAVNIQSDEVAGAGDLRIVSEDEVERKSAVSRFNQPKEAFVEKIIDNPSGPSIRR